jgi:LPXTG-motif cell wall-anchored protein
MPTNSLPGARSRIRTWAGVLLATGAATAGLALATSETAGALPNCGGNNDVKVAPVLCTNTRAIDGTTFTVVLDVNAAGAIAVTYTLDAPRSTDTPIRVRAHRGISSNPNTNEVSGTIPAGATSAVLAVQTNCGQVDVKAVFTGNGDARGRVAGPYITTADDCTSTPTTEATTVPPTTGPTTGPTTSTGGSTPPRSEAVTTLPRNSPPTPSGSSALSNRALPETGSDGPLLLALSAALVVAGVVLVTKSRARDTLPE